MVILKQWVVPTAKPSLPCHKVALLVAIASWIITALSSPLLEVPTNISDIHLSLPLRNGYLTFLLANITSSLGDDYDPTCFPPDYFPIAPGLSDCHLALRDLQADPKYTQNLTYTVNGAHVHQGTADYQVPFRYERPTCRIDVAATRGAPNQRFSLESQREHISAILKKCIINAKPGFAYGGYNKIGDQTFLEPFFVTISGIPSPRVI